MYLGHIENKRNRDVGNCILMSSGEGKHKDLCPLCRLRGGVETEAM